MNIAVGRRRINIVGDGPAASVTAMTLARRGWRVNVFPPFRHRLPRVRVDVVGATAIPTLLRLGLSRRDILSVAKECPGSWSLWDSDSGWARDHMASPHGFAWAVDRTRFDALLLARAADAGVEIVSSGATEPARGPEAPYHGGQGWRIFASGCLSARLGTPHTFGHDDKLIGIVLAGEISPDPVDERLIVEATANGWAYGVVGPDNLACLGIVTDAQAMTGQSPRDFAVHMISRTKHIANLAARLISTPTFQTVPIPCRWQPFSAGPGTFRIGDAQASFDPLSGRGLWEAIRRSEEMALILDANPDDLTQLEERSLGAYQRYLATRLRFYRGARDQFGTAFWSRRCPEFVIE